MPEPGDLPSFPSDEEEPLSLDRDVAESLRDVVRSWKSSPLRLFNGTQYPCDPPPKGAPPIVLMELFLLEPTERAWLRKGTLAMLSGVVGDVLKVLDPLNAGSHAWGEVTVLRDDRELAFPPLRALFMGSR